MKSMVAVFWAIVGSTLIGYWGDSAWLGIGVYCCIAAIGSWE